jgi:hypothetical protein
MLPLRGVLAIVVNSYVTTDDVTREHVDTPTFVMGGNFGQAMTLNGTDPIRPRLPSSGRLAVNGTADGTYGSCRQAWFLPSVKASWKG